MESLLIQAASREVVHLSDEDERDAFDAFDVRGDGNCLWYAVALDIAVDLRGREGAAKADQAGQVEDLALEIRGRVADELQDEGGGLREPYSSFFAPGEEGTSATTNSKEYISSLREGGICAGEMELECLARVLGVRVAVLNHTPSGITLRVFGSGSNVFFVRLENFHYTSLIPKNLGV